MRNALLIVWFALLGAERIDLFGGSGPFMLTPFLLLTPAVIVAEWSGVVTRRGWFWLPRNAVWYLLIVSVLLSLVLLSILFSHDQTVAAQRYALLLVQVYGVLVVAVALANRPDAARMLERGAYLGLAIHFLFSVLQFGAFFGIDPGAGSIVDLSTRDYHGLIPRLTGAAHDPNQGGIRLVAFLFILLRFGRPSRVRTLFVSFGVLFLLLTLSRSALLAAMGVAAFALLQWRGIRVSRALMLGGTSLVASAALALLLFPGVVEGLGDLLGILANRLTVREGSSSQHLDVLQRGWEVGTADVRHLLFGVGYGNAYLTLQDIFAGDRYGNYHSLFVSFLAESGIFSLALVVILLVYPLLRPGPLQPLFIGYLLYNLFQQTHTDPQFWFILTLAWIGGVGDLADGAGRTPSGRSAPAGLRSGFGSARQELEISGYS